MLADQNDVAPLCENFFAALHDGKVYGVEFYKHSTSPVSAGWKTRDNAALVCEPSTNSKAGRDDYVKRALFCPFNVDYTIDAATLEPKISAIEGVFGTYNAKAPAGLIGVMQQGGWVRYYDAGSSFGYEYADECVSSEFYPLEATVKASDNSVRSFMIHAKYAAGYGADGKLGSLSGAACAIRTISHNSQISMWKQRGAQYCGKSYADGGFVDLMFWLKYGDKANASKMQGCRSYAYTYAITVAQTDATVRARIFVRARRQFLRAWAYLEAGGYITIKAARRIISYRGYFSHTDSVEISAKLHIVEVSRAASNVISAAARAELAAAA